MTSIAVTPQGTGRDRARSWPERLGQVRRMYPSTMDDRAAMREALTDYDMVGRIMRDVLRIGWEAPKRGQRAPLEWNDGRARMVALDAQRAGRATTKPFAEAFRELAGGVTLDALASGVGISRSQVHRLLRGDIEPTTEEITAVAMHFDKPPTYFHEYRLRLICASLAEQLDAVPERSIDVLERMGVAPLVD